MPVIGRVMLVTGKVMPVTGQVMHLPRTGRGRDGRPIRS
jgi:hypothetical protein